MSNAPYFVVLDSNVWVAERLLQTSMGSAFLYALAGSSAIVGLPHVVEIEVNHVLEDQAEKAVQQIRKSNELLKQLSGHPISYVAPSPDAICDGVNDRWRQLDGILRRIPFTLEQASAALTRITATLPPCGENNEQFRDCCIWESAIALAAEGTVHFVTGDTAFYEGRDRNRGLARPLLDELAKLKRDIRIHSRLADFMTAMDKAVAQLDEELIGNAVVQALKPSAQELAAGTRGDGFELGASTRRRIKGYATPKPSVLALSFEVQFALKRIEVADGEERQVDAELIVAGTCSYEPKRHEVTDVVVSEWTKHLPKSEGSFFSGSSWSDGKQIERQYGPGRTRLIS
jgi:hypothetical protein